MDVVLIMKKDQTLSLLKTKFCPRCKREFAADVEFCSSCFIELKGVLFCERCEELYKLEGGECPECKGQLAPFRAPGTARLLEASARPSRFRYIIAIALLFLCGILVPRHFGLLLSLTMVFIFTFIGYFVGWAIDSLNPGRAAPPDLDGDVGKQARDAEKELELDNVVRCWKCGEELNLYTHKGIIASEAEPWRLFCATCGNELEADDF